MATHVRRWLMTGVGHMVPFVAAGGILIALSFLLAQVADGGRGAVAVAGSTLPGVAADFHPSSAMEWARLMYAVGATAFGLLVPVLQASPRSPSPTGPAWPPGSWAARSRPPSAPASSAASQPGSSAASRRCG